MKYVDITITTFANNSALDHAVFFYDDDEAGIHLCLHPCVKDAWTTLHDFEDKLGRKCELEINEFDNRIIYHCLHGFIG